MTSKELLMQEVENLPPELLTQALDLIRSVKVDTAKRELNSKPAESTQSNDSTQASNDEKITYRPASGRSILRHAGTWQGDDYEECLQSVYNSRGRAKFDDEDLFE
ncbi:hypothetical protein NIES4071_94770 [Calothrix sp. NIES-4071]|nr:hypothetical protein NIES4071_94770 [Calothrix sp. NIES-4071]BAZ63742.1 hypothetical protein NIES4105_94700 [Calothrix sp. NIES-4105]